ncbi:MAG: hypothetical protein IJ313_10995 [Clostridia bacterium]|nr:hypothetical protein [Clostridia bacterium]
MKRDLTTREQEMLDAEDRTRDSNRFGIYILSPALRAILDNIRAGHLSPLTAALILLLVIGALAFAVYFVTSDSEAVHQAQMLIEARKASSVQR